MRISKQISGRAATRDDAPTQGRGEYEWADLQPDDPTRAQLLNCRIKLRLPDNALLDTACELVISGGKWRIRRANDAHRERHIYPVYHLAVALLMPCPARQEQHMGRGLPVLRSEEYIISDIIAGHIPEPKDGVADIEARTARVANHTVPSGDDIDVAKRFVSVKRVWASRLNLPGELSGLLGEHEAIVRGGVKISIGGRELVERIQRGTADASRELDARWATPFTDPLPALMDMLGFEWQEPPPPVEEIPPEQLEIRRREIARQRRLAAARGAGSIRFRMDVRIAYRSTCVVCGLRLPALRNGGRSGVDSAHILPDSEFDLNHVANGVCLCKLHHWAFDEGLIEIRHDQGSYSIAVPEETRARADEAGLDLGFLSPHLGVIQPARLPANLSERPNPECLQRLNELLYP